MKASALLIVGATVLAVGGGALLVRARPSSPEGVAKRALSSLETLRIEAFDELLSATGKKRLRAFTEETFPAASRPKLAQLTGVGEAEALKWQGAELFLALASHRNALMTKGIDFEKLISADQFKAMAKGVIVGEAAIDGEHAVVPLREPNGTTSYLDMERENGQWAISYQRAGNEEPLWDADADIQLVRFNKRARASEAKTTLKELESNARSYWNDSDRLPTTFDQFVKSFQPGRYTYFSADSGAAGWEPIAGSARPSAGAVVLPPDITRFPGSVELVSYSQTGCPLTLAVADDGQNPWGNSRTTAGGTALKGIGVSNFAWLLAAAGNIDGDPDMDCWSISNVVRLGRDGETIDAYYPYQEHAD